MTYLWLYRDWSLKTLKFSKIRNKYLYWNFGKYVLSQRQILGTGNLPQDSAPVCINIDISPEMAAQSAHQTKHFVSPHLIGPQLHQLDLASKIKMPCANEGNVTTDNVIKTAWFVKIRILSRTSRDCNSKYHTGSKGCRDLYPHRLSQPTWKRCVDWSISRDRLGADICGELPELSETGAERSTGVPLLSAAESSMYDTSSER